MADVGRIGIRENHRDPYREWRIWNLDGRKQSAKLALGAECRNAPVEDRIVRAGAAANDQPAGAHDSTSQ
jgi:hypothetical protein